MDAMSLAMLIYAVSLVEGNPGGGFDRERLGYGPLCVTRGCVSDVNRRYGTHYRWPEDMRDYQKSSEVFIYYTRGSRDIGEMARVWNKGHRGKNKPSAWVFQRKVMERIGR